LAEPRAGYSEVKVEIPSVSDVPVMHANQMVVNFTGNEFVVTVLSSLPPPWTAGQKPNLNVTAQVLARYAVPIQPWVEIVKSVADQVSKLRAEGAPIGDQ
jgi:hypothetical protein